jgi:hypothetical protein
MAQNTQDCNFLKDEFHLYNYEDLVPTAYKLYCVSIKKDQSVTAVLGK